MAKKSTGDLLRAAKSASADLQTFGAVKSILEGSSAPRNMGQVGCYSHSAAVNKIITICNAEMQKALKHMDAASDELADRLENAEGMSGEYNRWIDHHSKGHDYDGFLTIELAQQRAAHSAKQGAPSGNSTK